MTFARAARSGVAVLAVAVAACTPAPERTATPATTGASTRTVSSPAVAPSPSPPPSPSLGASPGSGDPGAVTPTPDPDATVTAVVGARVFDGDDVLGDTTVVFSPDGIAAVGDVDVPDGATVVDGTGATLLPGLLDAHQHVLGERPLRRNADFGVTTVLDMFNDPGFARQMRAAQAAGNAAERADLFSAGNLATPPGGHGTQFGVTNLDTITRPDQADEWVRRRVDEGSDWIKVVVEPGRPGAPLPTLDRATVVALVAAAHDRDLLVVAHVSRSEDARMVVEAGVDGLAHVWLDGSAPEVVALLADRDVFVVPTLSVYDDRPVRIGQRLVDDPDLGPRLSADEVSNLDQSLPVTSLLTELALTSVGDLDEAGVTVLAGTDVGNPGVVAGASLHGELELLVEAGLTTFEALEAATLAPADAFGLLDRGRIEPGARADLVLVEGDPTTDITATRAIDAVWKAGVEIDLDRP